MHVKKTTIDTVVTYFPSFGQATQWIKNSGILIYIYTFFFSVRTLFQWTSGISFSCTNEQYQITIAVSLLQIGDTKVS